MYMSRFDAVPDQYDPDTVEDRVFEYWSEVDAYERTVEHRADGEPFFFVDGPPYTSGAAHMGTTWNKVLKDAYLRYLRMQGYDVQDRPGYDMHGLPIETRVEEQLGFANKQDIEEFGEAAFIEECKAFANEQLDGLQSDFQSFGVWMDWEEPYKTVSPEYMEAAWWAFAQANERGLVEQGQRSINQCPRCQTAIADNEVEYADVEDPSIYVKFPLRDRPGYLVIWTTTPWTIPADTFVAVDGESEYVGVDATNDGETERLYVAAGVVEDVLKQGRYEEYEIVERLDGEQMVGWEYDHPLREEVPAAPQGDDVLQVYTADYVEVDRTGLVHSAPGHGQEDFERGQELGLAVFCPVGEDGVFTDAAGKYAGESVTDADEQIITDLENKGLMLAAGTTTHSYGHCWRCDTEIIQIVTDQWFITISDIKDQLLANIEDSEWHPQWARDERFRDFVSEAPDWNVSRQRYWGTPIPIWLPTATTDGEPVEWSGAMADAIVIADRDELASRVDQSIDPDTVDLHKGTVDDLTITEDGIVYERVPDVFDVWLDSSVASWGTLDYPSTEADFEELWPADLIMEAHDQTRGWFWSQLGMGTAAFGEVPYETVLMHGFANMPDGRSMSKSKGIYIDPHEVIDRFGVDPMRLFLLSVTPQGEDMRFSWDETEELQRELNILWNVFRFPLPYMELDEFDPATYDLETVADALAPIDHWLLARMQSVIETMDTHWANFRQDKAAEALLSFVVDDLSRFYIQAVRERMWADEDTATKQAAYQTLTYVFHRVVRLLAPYTPLVAEELYGIVTGEHGHPTVHMSDWPTVDEQWQDAQLETEIEIVRAVEEAGANARQQAERKLRWPVPRVVVVPTDETTMAAIDTQRELLADRLNAQRIELVAPEDTWSELQYTARADMSLLGPAFGGRAETVMNAINEIRIDNPAVSRVTTRLQERDILEADEELTEEMITFHRAPPENVTDTRIERDGDELGVVYVDTSLTEAIEREGYARELIRRVQEMRKDLELDIDERIRLEYTVADDRVASFLTDSEELIAREVRADAIGPVNDGYHKAWEIEGMPVEITIARA